MAGKSRHVQHMLHLTVSVQLYRPIKHWKLLRWKMRLVILAVVCLVWRTDHRDGLITSQVLYAQVLNQAHCSVWSAPLLAHGSVADCGADLS